MSYANLNIRSNGKFLKIESGQQHQLRLLESSPSSEIIHGFGKDKSSCTGEGCFKCLEGSESKQRFSTTVYDHTLSKVLTWEFGAGIAKQLKEIDANLQKEESTIQSVDLKVSCSGSGMQKKYMVMPWMPPKPLPEGMEIPF